MEKEKRLDSKIKRLVRQAGHPKYFHHMGPKKFQLWILCFGLVIKQVYRLSFRRAMKFLDEFHRIDIHWTTLQKAARRLPKFLWQSLLAATINQDIIPLAAGDGTGFSRSSPSNYFLRRVDREGPVGRPVQLIALVDVKKRKFLPSTVFAKPQHEAHNIPGLHKQLKKPPEILLLDKGFDKESLHAWLEKHGTFSLAPVRKNARRGSHRKFLKECFDYCLYWQRNIVECLFSALKRLFGPSVNGKTIRTINAEIFCRLIAYNLGLRLRTFSTEPTYPIAF
jgi:transposase